MPNLIMYSARVGAGVHSVTLVSLAEPTPQILNPQTLAGTYFLTVTAWPYLDFAATIIATAPSSLAP